MEKSWKEILKEGQEPYDPQAWEQVSRRLDQVMPAKGKAFSPKNFLLGGSAAALIGVGLYFLVGNEEQSPVQTSSQKTEQNAADNSQSASGQPIKNTDNTVKPAESGKQSGSGSSSGLGASHSNKNNPQQKEQSYGPLVLENKADYQEPALTVNDPIIPLNNSTRFALPKRASEYCLNDEAELGNTNENRCLLTDESGNVLASLAGNSKTKIQLTKTGVYYFRYPKYDVKGTEISEQEKAFSVNGPQAPEFAFDNEINYDNGIPYINLKAQDFGNGMSWNSDKGEITAQTENTRLAVFRKGEYRVSLAKKDQQGCVAKKVVTITVREDYNLLAPTAFRPASSDPRNNRFMPVALIERNSGFELTISDPETGRTVFKSTSADNSWDGSDMTSEQADKVNKTYIWRVKLLQPERGEKSEYNGTVTRLIQ